MPGMLSRAEVAVVKQSRRRCIHRMRQRWKPKPQHHRRHQPPVHLPGIDNGGLNLRQRHHGNKTNGGRRSGEYTLLCGRGVTLRKNHRQGVTPCESSAEAAKGDLCIRSNSPSWLAVQAHAEAAKGDLCSRSDSPSWLSVCAIFFLFVVPFIKAHSARYSSRS